MKTLSRTEVVEACQTIWRAHHGSDAFGMGVDQGEAVAIAICHVMETIGLNSSDYDALLHCIRLLGVSQHRWQGPNVVGGSRDSLADGEMIACLITAVHGGVCVEWAVPYARSQRTD